MGHHNLAVNNFFSTESTPIYFKLESIAKKEQLKARLVKEEKDTLAFPYTRFQTYPEIGHSKQGQKKQSARYKKEKEKQNLFPKLDSDT